jgi:hypothetical protein
MSLCGHPGRRYAISPYPIGDEEPTSTVPPEGWTFAVTLEVPIDRPGDLLAALRAAVENIC